MYNYVYCPAIYVPSSGFAQDRESLSASEPVEAPIHVAVLDCRFAVQTASLTSSSESHSSWLEKTLTVEVPRL